MTKFLNGRCAECGGYLHFPAETVGTTANCPHCGKPTELMLAVPPPERTVPVKTIIYTVIAIVILIGGLVATMIALKRAERMTGDKSETRPPATQQPTAPLPARNQ